MLEVPVYSRGFYTLLLHGGQLTCSGVAIGQHLSSCSSKDSACLSYDDVTAGEGPEITSVSMTTQPPGLNGGRGLCLK